MRRLLIFTFFLCIPAFAQTKHPFTFEDMMALKRVAEPVPSPDGRWVLFSAVDVNLDANTKTPHIWIVPLDTRVGAGVSPVQAERSSAERILIADQNADRPRWAPDGKRFAFISTKEAGSQVWIADFDGTAGAVTAVHRLTAIKSEASGELWSPDGKNILFTSDVYPECDGGPYPKVYNCNLGKIEEVEKSKVKAQVFDHLLYRHWNAFKEGKRTHIFVIGAPPLAGDPDLRKPDERLQRDLTPGDFDSPVFSLGGQDNYAFSPDGQEICYASNHDKVEATSTNSDLWIVPLNGGVAKNITADNPAWDGTPLYSPDGKYIAYRAQKRPGYESDRFRLMLYDRKTGEKKNLTEGFDNWVGTFTWAPDSNRIFLVAENAGESPIFWTLIHPKGAADDVTMPWKMIELFNDDLVVTNDGKTILFTRMSVEKPNEVYRAEISEQSLNHGVVGDVENDHDYSEALTHINERVSTQIAIAPLDPVRFWFTGAHGDKVQGFLVKPPNFDASKKYPVKFLIHGGPQGAWRDDWSYRWNAELFAANGYVVIMINFHGSTGYGQKFIDAINGDWGGAPFEDLMKGLDYAEKTYPFIDKDRECALGASYGGYMADWILGHTDRFKCIVSHDGQFNTTSTWGTTEELWFQEWEFKGTPYTNREMYDKWSPHLSASNFKTPTLVVHGQRDYRLDVSEGFQLFTTLQRMNVPSKMLYFPDEGHWVLKPQNGRLWYQTVNAWVDQWTKK
jgi:dipeptidyl aminopeptidase/acylaminoacyl peptidase